MFTTVAPWGVMIEGMFGLLEGAERKWSLKSVAESFVKAALEDGRPVEYRRDRLSKYVEDGDRAKEAHSSK